MQGQGLKRRELFKLGAATGAAILGATALPRPSKAARATGFRVTFGPGPPADQVSVEADPILFKRKRTRPGRNVPGNALFRIPATPANDPTINDIKDWVKDAYDGKCVRKDITIELFSQAGAPVRTFNLIDTFPVHFNELNADSTSSADVLHWTLEVRVNRWESA